MKTQKLAWVLLKMPCKLEEVITYSFTENFPKFMQWTGMALVWIQTVCQKPPVTEILNSAVLSSNWSLACFPQTSPSKWNPCISYLKTSLLDVNAKYFRKKVFPFWKILNLTFHLACPFASVRLNKAIRKYVTAISKYKINGKKNLPYSFLVRKLSVIFNILKNSLFFLNMNDTSLLAI